MQTGSPCQAVRTGIVQTTFHDNERFVPALDPGVRTRADRLPGPEEGFAIDA